MRVKALDTPRRKSALLRISSVNDSFRCQWMLRNYVVGTATVSDVGITSSRQMVRQRVIHLVNVTCHLVSALYLAEQVIQVGNVMQIFVANAPNVTLTLRPLHPF
jgi:hypothetical protein